MKCLIVYLNNVRIGLLEQDDSGLLIFTYDQEWLDQPDSIPLSCSLPLQQDAFRGKYARSFFAGILPEEAQRRRIASVLGISERNDFAMLERIGGECAGAVSLLSADVLPLSPEKLSLHKLGSYELDGILSELPGRPLMAGKKGVRLSLAGAQGKLPVFIQDGTISLPLDNTPSTHIIKPEPEHFPGLAANELFCMKLAKSIGINVPAVDIASLDKNTYLIIKRYDRYIDKNGVVCRLHQEDFCQALGFPPEQKYQQEGGPLLRNCIKLLREWSTAPVLDILSLIDGLIFNVIIGNADAHGKNYSLLYRNGTRRLAPFYDLVCTLAWPELSKHLSMKIGGAKTLNDINLECWQKMAEKNGLSWPMMREKLVEVSQQIIDKLDDVKSDIKSSDMTDNVAEIIYQRAVYYTSL